MEKKTEQNEYLKLNEVVRRYDEVKKQYEYYVNYYWSESGRTYDSTLKAPESFDVKQFEVKRAFAFVLKEHLTSAKKSLGTAKWNNPILIDPDFYGFFITTKIHFLKE